jgi:hypothetical protein
MEHTDLSTPHTQLNSLHTLNSYCFAVIFRRSNAILLQAEQGDSVFMQISETETYSKLMLIYSF